MKDELILFSYEQGNLLIRLLLAHIISDFVFQTDKMVQNKKLFSVYMLGHIAIVWVSAFLLSGLWKVSLCIALFHWLIDTAKVELKNRTQLNPNVLFITDQLLHIITVIVIWLWHFYLMNRICEIVTVPFLNYKLSLMLLAYVWIIYPVSYIVKLATQSIVPTQTNQQQDNVEHGGKLIGQFERIIILTLVLLNQYEAIGFLITGKSIIRFADQNSNLRSEYVLVGTMMSYAIAILTGVLINYLLSL